MQASIPLQHAAYLGPSNDVDGWPEASQYGTPVSRYAYMVEPSTDLQKQLLKTDQGSASRVVTRKLVGVPSVQPYKVFDRITLWSKDFIITEVRDMSTGPFGYEPGGALLVERTDS